MKLTHSLATLGLLLGTASIVGAQYPYPPYGYGGYGGGGTVAGNAAHGMADVVRSAGYANLANSEALINAEAARKASIENDMQAADTYFQMRLMNREYRKQLDPYSPVTREKLIRYAQQGAPKRLDSTQLDPITGSIAWPLLLRGDQYADLRKKVEAFYQERIDKHGAVGPDEYMAFQDDVNQMTAILKESIREVPTGAYIASKQFLESLAYESQLPTG